MPSQRTMGCLLDWFELAAAHDTTVHRKAAGSVGHIMLMGT
jgi:hypothetical protein